MKFPFKKDYQLTKEDVVDCIICAISGIPLEEWNSLICLNDKIKYKRAIETIKFVANQKVKIDDSEVIEYTKQK